MLGSNRAPTAAAGAAAASTGPLAVPGTAASQTMRSSGASASGPIILVVLAALYFIWALIERHEKVSEAVEGHNIEHNLRSIGFVLLTVLVGFGFLKVALAKFAAWHVPGAQAALRFVAGAV